MNKILIAYFSRNGENYVSGKIKNLSVGNTEIAAKMIHDQIESTLFEVQPIHPYPKNYHDCTVQAKKEQKENTRPKILDYVHQFQNYDKVFLCYPNWWSTMPMAMFTFLEMHDLSHKMIYPVCTHEGSGLGQSVEDIKKTCPEAIVKPGLAIHGTEVHEAKNIISKYLDDNL